MLTQRAQGHQTQLLPSGRSQATRETGAGATHYILQHWEICREEGWRDSIIIIGIEEMGLEETFEGRVRAFQAMAT